jgi:hypothetical protein
MTTPTPQPDAQRHLEESLASVREALTGLRFGTVALTVHEGRVVRDRRDRKEAPEAQLT